MKAAVIESNKALLVREIPDPALPDGGALIRVSGCGVCGSDLDKLLHRTMPSGTVLGHEVVGWIETLSPEADREFPHLPVGQRVAVAHHVPCQTCYYCRHGSPTMCRTFKQTNIEPGGFSDRIAVTRDHLAHSVFPLPDDISDAEGSCVEPLACCLRAVEKLPTSVGTHAAMIGLGFIGLLTAQALKLEGYTVYGVDLKQDRVELACTEAMVDVAETQPDVLLERARTDTEGRGVDVVFLTVVNPATLELALKLVRDGGILLLFASYGPGTPILDQNALYFREISVLTSYSPAPKHLRQAYELISQGKIRTEPLISDVMPVEAIEEAMERYRSGEAMKVFIRQ